MKNLIKEAKRLQQLAGIIKEDLAMDASKNYLKVHIGSRGEIEDIAVIDGNTVKSDIDSEYSEFLDDTDPEYAEEFGHKNSYDWGYSLGLGEEDGKEYIDMSSPIFLKWQSEIEQKMGDDWSWNDIADQDVHDLLGQLPY